MEEGEVASAKPKPAPGDRLNFLDRDSSPDDALSCRTTCRLESMTAAPEFQMVVIERWVFDSRCAAAAAKWRTVDYGLHSSKRSIVRS